jgi:hypothetical protein
MLDISGEAVWVSLLGSGAVLGNLGGYFDKLG